MTTRDAQSRAPFWYGMAAMALLTLTAAGAADAQAPLPPDIVKAIRADYVADGMATRYLDATVDLDGDGTDEWIVHVVGPMACGTGGCPTLVFAPTATGYRLVTAISVSRPPIGVATTRTHGWRNLVVHVSGGGQKGRDVELAFDGSGYPSNPSVRSARVTPAQPGPTTLIAPFTDFNDTKALP